MIPFSPPRIDQKTVDEVAKVLLSGWVTTGPRTKEFEKKLSSYVGCRKTLCLNSATAGMELVLRWFGVKEGDEVIVPAYTYCATANVVIHCGATPVMADVTDDFTISVEEIRKKITARTKVIMPVDIGGWPCDYDAINDLVNSAEIKKLFAPGTDEQKKLGRILILADAAHSIGATYKGKMQGSITDVAVFSFHAVKNLTTAEGGAICLNLPAQFNTDEIYDLINIKSLHGQNKDALAKSQVGAWRYDVIEPGFKCNMMDIQAAIGLIELERYNKTLKRRKEIVEFYSKSFKDDPFAIVPVAKSKERESCYHLFLLRIKNATEEQRDQIITKIFEKEVSVNVHFQPLPLLTAYKSRGYKIDDYPMARDLYTNEITLPVYYNLTAYDLNTIVAAVKLSVAEVMK